MLDTNLTELFADHAALNRVVETIALDQGVDFMQALEQLHQGVDSEGAGSTLQKALEWTKSEPADVGETLQLLERRDETVRRTLEQALAADPELRHSRDGVVLLDQGSGGVAADAGMDAATALADPAEAERRWVRACRVDGSFKGDDGHKRFLEEDHDRLLVGQDMVRTLEAAAARRAAEHKAEQTRARLDQAIRANHGKRARARAIEAEIATLDGERANLAGEAAAPAREEQALRLLDAAPGDRPLLSTVLQSRMIDLRRERPELGHEELRRHVLEAAESGCPLTLDEEAEQWHRGIYFGLEQQCEPGPAATEPADPSRAMNLRVLERMRVLNRPDSAYQRTAEELMAEDEGRTQVKTLDSALLSRSPSPPARKILEEINAQKPDDLNEAVRLLAQHPAQASNHAAWREAFELVAELGN